MFNVQAARLKDFAIAGLIFFITLAIYLVNLETTPVSDSRWAVYVALSLVREGNSTLDEYEALIASHDNYAVLVVDGHLHSLFPLGASMFAVPVVFAVDKLDQAVLGLDLHEHMRLVHDRLASNLERFTAAVIAALASVVIYGIGRLSLSRPRGLLLVLIFSLGTSMWSTASHALRQHGPLVLMLSIALYLLLAAQKKPKLAQFASLPLAMAFVIRPTSSIAILFLTVYVFIAYRRYFLRYLIWSALIVIPFLLSNVLTYNHILPPYYLPGRLALFGPTFVEALAGNLISPARGLIVYSPILLFSLYGIYLKIKDAQFTLLDGALAAIIVLHWLVISSFPHWYGGHSYGPRFFTDVLPFIVYFLIPVLAAVPWPLTWRAVPLTAVFVLLLMASLFTHGRGAVDPAAALVWNRAVEHVNEDVDSDPQRVWDYSDPPFLRGLRPGHLATIPKTPLLVAAENGSQELQLTLVNKGDRTLDTEIMLPQRLKMENSGGADNGSLAGMSSRTVSIAVNAAGLAPGEHSLGGIQINASNQDGGHTAGSPFVVPVSVRIQAEIVHPSGAVDQEVLLPVVVRADTYLERFLPPVDILLNGRAQSGQDEDLIAVFGSGWHDREGAEDNWRRWANSPAEILVFSSEPQKVTFISSLDAGGSNEPGPLKITINDLPRQEVSLEKKQSFSFESDLVKGWNVITLSVDKGGRQEEGRPLRFAVSGIDIRVR